MRIHLGDKDRRRTFRQRHSQLSISHAQFLRDSQAVNQDQTIRPFKWRNIKLDLRGLRVVIDYGNDCATFADPRICILLISNVKVYQTTASQRFEFSRATESVS